ncbi:MAG: oligopeptidase A, partial [Gammaproteobacteria bacterium]|nr:oligopeptidase A [Gammaproteobacteria bacterium]
MNRHLDLPQFDAIDFKTIEPELDRLLTQARASVNHAVQETHPTWHDTLLPMDEADNAIHRFFSTISHLNAVKNSAELRPIYEGCLQKLAQYETELGQREDVYHLVQKVASEDAHLTAPQQQALKLSLRNFRLSGVDLPEASKRRFMEIQQRLAQLSSEFSNHVLDCTDAFQYEIQDANRLQGLPNYVLEAAQEKAKKFHKTGYVLDLQFPTYHAVLTYAEDRQLREDFYRAYNTRASDQGPHDHRFDNSAVMAEILDLRQEESALLGFPNFSAYSLATKMADSETRVLNFLNELAEKSRPFAERELKELKQYAKETHGFDGLKPWDIAYYSEKYQQTHFEIDQEALRAYFPIDRVLPGLFELIQGLFGVQFIEKKTSTWHPDVHFYELYENQTLIGGIYLDLYARENKRGGAWMDDARARRITLAGDLQLPVAYLTCNFTPPARGKKAQLLHDEVITLFHEMGHCLQHLLTEIEDTDVSGINGVAWDAVELPSQFMENFCWELSVLQMISAHEKTGHPIDEALFQKLKQLRHFQSGLAM